MTSHNIAMHSLKTQNLAVLKCEKRIYKLPRQKLCWYGTVGKYSNVTEYEHRISVSFAKQSGALKILRPYEKRFEAHFEGWFRCEFFFRKREKRFYFNIYISNDVLTNPCWPSSDLLGFPSGFCRGTTEQSFFLANFQNTREWFFLQIELRVRPHYRAGCALTVLWCEYLDYWAWLI